jgi:hypothetical protein
MALFLAEIKRLYSATELKKGLGLRMAYMAFQAADLLLTWLAMSSGYQELNPFVRGLFASPAQLIIFKIFIPAIIAWLVPARLLIPAILLLIAVTGFNVAQLLELILL